MSNGTISGGDEDRESAALRRKLAAALLALVLLVGALWWMQRGERAPSEAEAQEAAAASVRDDAAVAERAHGAVTAPSTPVAQTPAIDSAAMTGATKPFDAPMVATEPASTNGCAFPMLDAAKQPFKLYAAGAYSGRKLGFQIDQSGNEAGRIDVGVNRPGEAVALMLGSYDPTVWHVGWSRGTRIVAVLVGGYHRQVVTGLPRDVPVIVSTYDNKGSCGYFYVTADKASTLNPVARRAFGRSADVNVMTVVVGQRRGIFAMMGIDQLADEDRVSAELVPVRRAADKIGLGVGQHRYTVFLAPIASGKAVLAARLLEHFGDFAITQPEHVHAERLRAGERFVQRRRTVDADEQRWRLETERAHRGRENAVPFADRAGRYGIDCCRDVPHCRTERVEQFGMGLRAIAHPRSMGRVP